MARYAGGETEAKGLRSARDIASTEAQCIATDDPRLKESQ